MPLPLNSQVDDKDALSSSHARGTGFHSNHHCTTFLQRWQQDRDDKDDYGKWGDQPNTART